MRKLDPIKHEGKRQEIIAAAMRCFIRDGFRGASTSDICAESRISPGNLYHYFESKEAILKTAGEVALAAAAVRFRRILEGPDVISALISEIEQAKSRIERGGRLLLLDIFAESGRNPAIAQILHEASRTIIGLIAEFVRRGQAQGKVNKDLDPDVTASVLLGIADGARLMSMREPKLDTAKSLEYLKLVVIRFLTP